ncbi:hypothetical protein AB1Y20_017397 [Prymnesium parvum]|uniref:ADP-ribosylation factor-like protein 13B n=1 Tax=Prymnesium parvum TaxID=97485 RepID=A0AB34JN25_PRYPA
MGWLRKSARVSPEVSGSSSASRKQKRPFITRMFRPSSASGSSPVAAEQTIIMLGLDNAGKTTLIQCLRGVRPKDPTPTVGFNNNPAKLGSTPLTLYDVGGGKQIRGIWDAYYADVHAAVFVVDAADSSRFPEACELLHQTCAHECFAGKPLLVLANKQDLPHAVGPVELAEALRLHELTTTPYQIAASTITSELREGTELYKALSRLLQSVASNRSDLQARIERQQAEAMERDRKRKEERKARLEAKRKAREEEQRAQEADAAASNSADCSGMQPSTPATAPESTAHQLPSAAPIPPPAPKPALAPAATPLAPSSGGTPLKGTHSPSSGPLPPLSAKGNAGQLPLQPLAPIAHNRLPANTAASASPL